MKRDEHTEAFVCDAHLHFKGFFSILFIFLHNVAFVGGAILENGKKKSDRICHCRGVIKVRAVRRRSVPGTGVCVSQIDGWVDGNECTFSPSILPLSH